MARMIQMWCTKCGRVTPHNEQRQCTEEPCTTIASIKSVWVVVRFWVCEGYDVPEAAFLTEPAARDEIKRLIENGDVLGEWRVFPVELRS